MSFDDSAREEMVRLGAALYDRGLTPGRSGNLSIRHGDELLMTPTNVSLGRLDPERLAVVSIDGAHRDGDKPSKELPLHQALYRSHPGCFGIAHLHSTSAVAVSCLPDLPRESALPALTPYFVMRVGTLPLVAYAPPGSAALEAGVAAAAKRSRALLLQRHGTLAAAATLEGAVDTAEEIEETARLFLLLQHRAPTTLDEAQVAELHRRFPLR